MRLPGPAERANEFVFIRIALVNGVNIGMCLRLLRGSEREISSETNKRIKNKAEQVLLEQAGCE